MWRFAAVGRDATIPQANPTGLPRDRWRASNCTEINILLEPI
jgi:hypothetical protein